MRRIRTSSPGKIACLSLLAGLLSACLFESSDPDNRIRLHVDDFLLTCSRVEIQQVNGAGTPISTLFNARLTSARQVDDLRAPKYAGGQGSFDIKGYKGSDLVYSVTVDYTGYSSSVRKKNIFTFYLRNYTGTSLKADIHAGGDSFSGEVDPGNAGALRLHYKPASLTYSATTRIGTLYSWSGTAQIDPSLASDYMELIASSDLFVLRVTNKSDASAAKVIVNVGRSDQETKSIYIPASGSQYDLGLFPANAGTAVRFETALGDYWEFPSLSYLTASDHGYKYVELNLL